MVAITWELEVKIWSQQRFASQRFDIAEFQMKEEQKTHCERVQEEFQEIEMIQIRPVISANKVFVVISYVK